MDIVFISDTHCKHNKVSIPDGDILIHCGDFTSRGHIHEIAAFDNWLGKQPHKHKIICAGNHDMGFETHYSLARSLITNAKYVQDEVVEVEGLSIYCSPYSPTFCNWAFMRNRGSDILERWKLIPEGLDILVTHGPPFSIQDTIFPNSENLGCVDLYHEVTLRIKPKIHAFGHIHGGYGQTQIDNTLFINASVCDEAYVPINKPIKVQV